MMPGVGVGKLEAGSLQVGEPCDRGAFLTITGLVLIWRMLPAIAPSRPLWASCCRGVVWLPELVIAGPAGQSSIVTHNLAIVHLCIQLLNKPVFFFDM